MAGISINLAGNFGKLDELKDKAHKTAASIKSAFGSTAAKAMFAGIATAGTAAFAGVVAAMKSAIDAGGELSDMMARTGAAGKGLMVLQQAFSNAGIAAGQVPAVLNKMQKALAGVNEEGDRVTTRVFDDLGLSIDALQSMDPAEAFRKIGEAISQFESPAKRAAIAMEIFGRSGGELLVLMQDSRAFSTAEQQIGGLANTLATNADSFDAVSDSLQLLGVKYKQLGAEVALSLLPQLTAFSQWANEVDLSQVGSEIGMLAEHVVTLSIALAQTVKQLPGMAALAKHLETIAKNNPAPGIALPTPDVVIGADGIARRTQDTGAAAADQVFGEVFAEADKDPFAEPDVPKEQRDKAIKEWEGELAENRAHQDRVRAIEDEDAARKKAIADAKRKAAEDAKAAIQDVLAGKVNTAQGKLDALGYQSSIGALGSLQRVGGGGGAVSSGLDYARQAADLQREANGYLRQLIEISRRDIDL
jgi:hypothetical protein